MEQKIPEYARYVLEALEAAGHSAYLVGGCVRDMLLRRQPCDFDIATSATPEETAAAFPEGTVLPTGVPHGTVTVLRDHHPVEVTTFRAETGYTDRRHPDGVRFLPTVDGDLARRDFTINAMAMGLGGEVIDLFCGREDLKNKIVRCVGQPEERFSEDALRILRALRFASQLDFRLDQSTGAAAAELKDALSAVSAERIYGELKKLLLGPGAGRIVLGYRDILLPYLPALPEGEELRTVCRAIDSLPAELPVRLAAIFRGASDELTAALKLLRADNKTIEAAALLAKSFSLPAPGSRPETAKLLSRLHEKSFFSLTSLWRAYNGDDENIAAAEGYARALIESGACLSLRELAVTGGELISAGVPAGPEVGRLLNQLLSLVLEEKLPNQKEKLLSALPELTDKKNG